MSRPHGSKNKNSHAGTDSKSYSWFITENNPAYTGADLKRHLKETHGVPGELTYCKWGYEEGEGEGTPHVHIYLHYKTQVRFSAIKKMFPRADVGEPIGTPRNQIDYIGNPDYVYADTHPDKTKAGKRKGGICTSRGDFGSLQGIRLDNKPTITYDSRLLSLKALIDAGQSYESLFNADFPICIKYGRQLLEYALMRQAGKKKDEMSTDLNGRLLKEVAEQATTIKYMENELCWRESLRSGRTEEEITELGLAGLIAG